MTLPLLVDTGPLVALQKPNDSAHAPCVQVLRQMRSVLTTTWPVVTEAIYLLGFSFAAQEGILEMIEQGDLQLLPLDARDVPRMRALMHKYRDLPMDLADASLVLAAEREAVSTVFTLDRRHFGVYRLQRGKQLTIIP